jgi:hypothetical protein
LSIGKMKILSGGRFGQFGAGYILLIPQGRKQGNAPTATAQSEEGR